MTEQTRPSRATGRAVARTRRAVLASALAGWAVGHGPIAVAAEEPSSAAPRGAPGKHDVRILERIALTDVARGREIPTRIHMPAAPGRFPVVIFSHGFGGDLGAFANTSRIWASHGYVVIQPTHADSVRFPDPGAPSADRAALRLYAAGRRGGAAAGGREGFVRVLENPFYLASRLADIAYIAALLEAGEGIDPGVHASARFDRMGMAGHSYGAYTTLVVAGAELDSGERNADENLRRKFSAFLAISGQGPGRLGLSAASFVGVRGPVFSITGTRDFGAAGETPAWRLEPYELSPPGRKYAALVRDYAHSSFDPAPNDAPSARRGEELRALEVAFWDAWLKGDRSALAELAEAAQRSTRADAIWLRAR